ncbi:MAG: TIGR01212 family radical SAM protein [Candidatus Omnitrophota bacterium]
MEELHRPYYKFSDYLQERFGCRVHKVSIDAGFSCPNRDGTTGSDGCIFCNNQGFSLHARLPEKSIRDQIKKGVEAGIQRFKAEKFIIYFQAYTNTYAPLAELREKYDVVRSFYNIAAIAIGTRPDCLNAEVLDLIESYAGDYEVWLELGLQSIHDKTLGLINRGHSYQQFLDAYAQIQQRKAIKVCVHVILGLPGESQADMLDTAKELARLRVDAVKIHPLHVLKGTKLERMFKAGEYSPMALDEYAALAVDFLEYLWPQTVVQRISADAPADFLVAPQWLADKNSVLQKIDTLLNASGKFQGRLYQG